MSSKEKDTMVDLLEDWLAENGKSIETVAKADLPDNLKQIYDVITDQE